MVLAFSLRPVGFNLLVFARKQKICQNVNNGLLGWGAGKVTSLGGGGETGEAVQMSSSSHWLV